MAFADKRALGVGRDGSTGSLVDGWLVPMVGKSIGIIPRSIKVFKERWNSRACQLIYTMVAHELLDPSGETPLR